jgi:uncharacterized protein
MSITTRIIGHLWHLPAPTCHDICEQQEVRAPMRDGVELMMDRYHPREGENLPVVLIRSPYGRGDIFHHVAVILAERGFQVLLQSCRGTGGSGGILHPSFHEERDGCDTIGWVARQPWYCGKLAIIGASYLGNAGWAAAHCAGSKIAALALAITLSDARAETYAFGGFTLEACLAWTSTLIQLGGGGEMQYLLETILPRVRDEENMLRATRSLPLRNADQVGVGRPVTWWREWVEHAEPDDPFWNPIDYSAVPSTAPPSIMIGGWHDVFLPWQVKDFEAAQAAGRDVSLTIGPWKHAAFALVGETVRQALPLFQTHLLKAAASPRAPVRLFVIGAAEWREYPCWPPPEMIPTPYYLAAGGGLSTTMAPACDPSCYDYDPSDPTPSVHGPTLQNTPALGDMAKLESRSDVVLFTAAPLDAHVDFVGPVWAELFFQSNLEHTDFYLCLCDVDPEGRSANVCDGYIRVRPQRPEPLADGTRCVRMEFWPTGYRYQRGHRIRVIVASGAHPRYARNLGSGESLGDAVTLKVAHQQVFHDSQHPSRIVLPACPRTVAKSFRKKSSRTKSSRTKSSGNRRVPGNQ